jgi:hypothetical protein
VRSIAASRYDAATAYVTVDFHQMNGRDPFIYRTTDYGQTFKLITNGIPKSMLSYAKVIHEDPVRRGMLYVGTENAIYVSWDNGDTWQPLQNDLPHAPVSGIVVQEHFNDLVISTYGRGFWILDDITALRALPDVLGQDAHLFPLRPAYRFRGITAPSTPYDDPTVGENPQYGASINYYLKGAVQNGGTLQVLDAKNQVVRSMNVAGTAGLNRVYWDLRGAPTKPVRMRTNPLYGHELPLGEDGTRPATGFGGGGLTILQPPGTYTVKLTIGGRDYTQPLTVRKDPHSGGTEADIQSQVTVLSELAGNINTTVDAVNQLEYVRAQVQTTIKSLPDGELKRAAVELEGKLSEAEMNLVDLRITGGQDGVRYAAKLLGRFGYLANGMAGSDFKPTDQALETSKLLHERLKGNLSQIGALIDKDVATFNEMLRRGSAGQIITKAPGQ